MNRCFSAFAAVALAVSFSSAMAQMVTSSTVNVSMERVNSPTNIPLLCIGYNKLHRMSCAQMDKSETKVHLLKNFQYRQPPKHTKVTALLRWDPSLVVDEKSCAPFPHTIKSSVRTFNGGLQDYTAVTFTVPVDQDPGALYLDLVFNGQTNTMTCSKARIQA